DRRSRETPPLLQEKFLRLQDTGVTRKQRGTGTVVIRVDDQNDNSPRLARRLWELQVEETPSTAPPPNTTLLELTAADRDAHNTFLYRTVRFEMWCCCWVASSLVNSLGAIGTLMDGSEINEILGTIIAENAVQHIMPGKAVQRALRGHLFLDQCLT
ncbi:hypothetical protein O3P69_013536, partial [Scylla paramamosain]